MVQGPHEGSEWCLKVAIGHGAGLSVGGPKQGLRLSDLRGRCCPDLRQRSILCSPW